MNSWLCLAVLALGLVVRGEEPSLRVNITVQADQKLGSLRPTWRMFGADEPNYATSPEGKKLLQELGTLSRGQVFFRAHNLLCSGDGTPALKWGSTGVYAEDAAGRPVYNWKILDAIFDTYLANGVRPYAQIGFMPQALSTHSQPYQHHWRPGDKYSTIETGWAFPPRDYEKWRELVYQWAKHCRERYGNAEVQTWYWEVWNEANGSYWKATPEEFFKLHDFAVDGVRRALPDARVGGPDCAGPGADWMRRFLEHCLHGTNYATGKIGTPLNFVSFHAKGAPSYLNEHVRMGLAQELQAVESGFRLIHSFPELRSVPVVIGECDPDGCAACQGKQLGYRVSTMYSSYTAASFARIWALARREDVNLEGALTWAFTFPGQPLFAGFRQLATGGIDLPVLNVFRMFSQMAGEQLRVSSDGEIALPEIVREGAHTRPDISGLATLDGNKIAVLLWHYDDDDIAGPEAKVNLTLRAISSEITSAQCQRYGVDAHHGNAYAAWQAMGAPQQPSEQQLEQLQRAGGLALETSDILPVTRGQVQMELSLPRQAVVLLKFQMR